MKRNLIILLSLFPLNGQAEVSVITSIEPLYQLTKTIMRGVGTPELLIKRQASAHHFAFKPSHFRLLHDADLVIWIDRHFESGFQALPQILPEQVMRLELLRALNLQQQNGHIWYSPLLLRRIAQQIRDALSRVDPAHNKTYKRNTRALSERLKSWKLKSEALIQAAKPRYLLDHNFLGHFENDMGIEHIAVLHDTHDQTISIRALQMVEKTLIERPAACLLTNNPTASKLARNLARKFDLKIYSIDQAHSIADTRSPIIQTLNQLRSALLNCR